MFYYIVADGSVEVCMVSASFSGFLFSVKIECKACRLRLFGKCLKLCMLTLMKIMISLFYAEKISTLEEKIEYQEAELQSKDNRISELCAQLEEAKMKNEYQLQIEEISMMEF